MLSLTTGSLHSPLNDCAVPEAAIETIVDALNGPGWCVIPDFMNPDVWEPMAAEALALHDDGGFRHAGVGRGESFQIRPGIRNDRVRWVDPLAPTQIQQDYLVRIEKLRLAINCDLMLGLFGFEGHFALYPEGSFYRRHLDRFANASHRTVTCIAYLNEDWQPEEGGSLRIYMPDAKGAETHVDIMPQGGSAVIFLSGEFEHEVLPAHRPRLSLTGWYLQRC